MIESPKRRQQRILSKTYHQTPHPVTGIPPASFIFRDGVKTAFPRKAVSDDDIKMSRVRDEQDKKKRQKAVNSSKYVKHDSFSRGDMVMVRDANRRSKFSSLFLPDPFVVVDLDDDAGHVILEDMNSTRLMVRHLDDVKPCYKGALAVDPIVEEANHASDSSNERLAVVPSHIPEMNGSDDVQDDSLDSQPPPLPEPRRSLCIHSSPKHYPEGEWSA